MYFTGRGTVGFSKHHGHIACNVNLILPTRTMNRYF